MKAHNDLFSIFDENGIKAAVMKGVSAARYYPKPDLRQFGDIDVIVLPEDYDRAFHLLKESGYTNMQELDSSCQRHIGFGSPDGKTEIELHRYFSSSLNENQNSLLDNWLYEKLPEVEKINVGGYSVSAFPPLENGLILLGHINQHLSSGLGLRQITDWMMYVKAVLNDSFWKNGFEEKARAIGMDYLAKVVTKMCRMYLGLTGEITWCDDAEEDLAAELMEYINDKGNFGRKISSESRQNRAALRYYFSNPVRGFRNLTKNGMTHMKAAGLKPRKAYAWLYQIWRMVKKLFKRENKSDMMWDIRANSRDVDLMKRLKVTRL